MSNNRSISAIDRERIDRQGANTQEETAAATSSGSGNQTESQNDTENSSAEKTPSITSPRWEDENGKTITKALVGDEVFLCADVTDIADGTTAKINIVEKDGDTDSQQELEEKGYTLPEYAFTVECDGVKSEESGQLDVRDWISFSFSEEDKVFLKNNLFYFYSGDWKSETFSFSTEKQIFKDIPLFRNNELQIGVIKNG